MKKIRIDACYSPCGHEATIEISIPYLAEGCVIKDQPEKIIRPQKECPICNCRITVSDLVFGNISVKKE